MKVVHSENNQNPPDRMNPDYGWLWKIRRIFDYLNSIYSTLYHPTENLALDEVIVKIKGRVVFWQYIPNKNKEFGINLYQLCDGKGYMYDIAVYLGKQLLNAASNITPCHGTVLQLTREVEGDGHTWIIIFLCHKCFLTYTVEKSTVVAQFVTTGRACQKLWV